MSVQFMVMLGFLAAFVGLVWRLFKGRKPGLWLRRGSRLSFAAVLVTAIWPAVVICWTMLELEWEDRAILRVAQTGYRIRMDGREPGSKSITVGGNRSRRDLAPGERLDDLFINRLPGGFLKIAVAESGFRVTLRKAGFLAEAEEEPEEGDSLPHPGALFAINGKRKNVHRLQAGSLLLVKMADGGELGFTLDPGGPLRAAALVAPGGVRLELSKSPARLPMIDWRLPVSRPFTEGERVDHLGDLLARASKQSGRAPPPGLASFVFATRSFPWFDFSVALLDPEVRVREGGRIVGAKTEFTVPEIRGLDFWQSSGGAGRRGGLRPLTGLGQVRIANNSFEIDFRKPRRVTVEHRFDGGAVATFWLAAYEPPPNTDSLWIRGHSQRFENAGAHLRLTPPPRLARRLVSAIDEWLAWAGLLESASQGDQSGSWAMELVEGRGRSQIASSERFELGRDYAVFTSVEIVELPLGVIAWILVLCMFQWIMMRETAVDGFQVVLVSVVNVFLGFRLLVAFKAVLVRPFHEEGYELALFALFFVPAWVIVMRDLWHGVRRVRGEWLLGQARRRLWCVGLFLACLGYWTLGRYGVGARLFLVGLSLLPAMLFEVARFFAAPSRGGRSVGGRWMVWLRDLDGGAVRTVLWALAACGLVRMAFWFLGFRESVRLGGRLAFEMFYTPVIALLGGLACGLIIEHFCRAFYEPHLLERWDLGSFLRRRTPLRLGILYGVLLLSLGGIGALVSDLGMLVPNGLGVLLVAGSTGVFFLVFLVGRRGYGLLKGVAALGALGLVILFLFPWILLGWGSTSDGDSVSYDRNRLRLMAYFDPERVADLGTRSAQEILEVRRRLDAYASIKEPRYLGAPMPMSRPEDLNDQVAAIYILADFGPVGGFFLLWCLLLLAAVPFWDEGLAEAGRAGPGERAVAPRLVAAACLGSMSATGMYMLAANVGIVPLTGKSIYLLGINSLSDLVTTSLLLGIAVLALEMQRWIDGLSR